MLGFSGFKIVHATTTILIFSTFIIFASGIDDKTFDSVLILSGRLGLILFALSFGASKFHAIFRAGWSQQLLKNRRYLGIASAIAMFIHLVWVFAKVLALPEWWASVSQYEKVTGLGSLFLICVMGLTSNDKSLKVIGLKNWKLLHLIGGYLALYLFTMEYVNLIFPQSDHITTHSVPLIAYLLLMLSSVVVIARLVNPRSIRNLLIRMGHK